jgi:hypothetical protein
MIQIEKCTYVEDLINDPNFNTDEYYGYVYMTTNLETSRQYIGKKIFKHTQNKKLGKKELAALPTQRGRVPSKKKIVKESDWKTYYGSADEVKQWAKTTPTDKLIRVVLRLCKTKISLSYYEVKYQMIYGVLENEEWCNDSILGKFYRKNIIDE